jgi:dihydrofolate reductase
MAGDQGAGGGLSEPAIALIAAVARNGVIGSHNALAWRLSSDLKRFRALTMGKPLIIGRKTWDSIGRLLPGRQIIVITRNAGFSVDDVLRAASLDDALSVAREIAASMGAKEIIVAGGGEIYRQSIPLAHRLYITEVDLSPQGDAHFPEIDPSQWREVRREKAARDAPDEADSEFVEYARR